MNEVEEYYEKKVRPTMMPWGLPAPSIDKLPESIKQKVKDALFFEKLATDIENFMVNTLGVKPTV